MNIRTILAVATVLALGCFGTAALARNWLTNEPDASVPTSEPQMLDDSSINYGTRAHVRIYRPDGEYDLRNGKYERRRSGQGDLDTETTDN
jgi:hypothetical protein